MQEWKKNSQGENTGWNWACLNACKQLTGAQGGVKSSSVTTLSGWAAERIYIAGCITAGKCPSSVAVMFQMSRKSTLSNRRLCGGESMRKCREGLRFLTGSQILKTTLSCKWQKIICICLYFIPPVIKWSSSGRLIIPKKPPARKNAHFLAGSSDVIRLRYVHVSPCKCSRCFMK